IWASVDETTDATGRFVAHLVVGKLVPDERTTPFLVCSKTLERTNGETVAYFVNASLKVLYPTGLEDSRVLLLYTDAAAYMHKAALLLKAFYPRMLHVTCLAHGIHRICEELRKHFKHVNDLEQLPGVPLPPEPIVTRWGTWLKAEEYYSTNFAGVKMVINGFPADDSVSVRKAQDVLREDTLECDLAYLCSNFTFLADTIKSLESTGETLARNIGLISNVQERVDAVPAGPAAVQVRSKL
ncbi:unnamed protein product, partial [Ixodes hexagonus]